LRKGSAVCIVDDDESVRVSTTRLLRLEGFSAYAFSSASEYLHSGRVGDTRCLVADVRLEGMSGRELFQHLRDQGRQIPTVFITAIADDRFRAWAKDAGAIAVFGKPFDGRALVESVRKAFADNAGSSSRR
jgi:FixJ family two-component response regulator